MKVSLTEEQYQRIQHRFVYETFIDEMVFKISLIIENDGKTEPDMEWDFTNIKKDLDKSKSWVKTKQDAIDYIETLKEKINNLPTDLKKKILKYILYSFIGLISLDQINDYLTPKLEKAVKKEKRILRDLRVRKSSDTLFNHLKEEEKLKLKAYNLGDGAYTIGYGHAIFPKEKEKYDFLPSYKKIRVNKTSITKEQAEELLEDDVIDAEDILNEILDDWESQGIKPKITQGMYDAMISMIFNMGRKGFRTSDFIQYVKLGDLEKAKKEILNTSSHMFNEYPGLKTRRQKEYEMFK